MAIWVELRGREGTPIRGIADPSGGTFDAAGDFDRFIGSPTLPTLGSIDPYADTTLVSPEMPGLLHDIQVALGSAREGPEVRGLMRLESLARHCQEDLSTHLVFVGD
jgi:hypothetical protein